MIAPYLRLIRPHQWVKNVLVFLPLLAGIDATRLHLMVPASLAFIAFSLVASAGYVANDLYDVSADRRHPRKRMRPIASGAVPSNHALALIPLLLLAGFVIAYKISNLFMLVLFVYLVGTSLYSFWLKRVPLLDAIVLAGLYTTRVLAGAAAISVVPSPWLLSFCMFFFLSLALAKRHSEMLETDDTDLPGMIPGRGYRPHDLSTLISLGSASGYAAILVLALFIDSSAVRLQYRHPELIWLICPLALYWISKLWLNSARHEIKVDPVIWAITNRVSVAIAALSVLLLLLARLLP